MKIEFDTFTIERTYRAGVERVFRAWATPEQKRRWFAEGPGFTLDSYELDFRVGGFERSVFRPDGGPRISNDCVFHDIVPNERIVCSYAMAMEGKTFSASLGTLEVESLPGGGTRLRYTEQGAYYENGGPNQSAGRREGSTGLLASLAKELGE